MIKESILITAEKKGFVPLAKFTSVSGYKHCFVSKLMINKKGDVVDKHIGVVYHKETDTWAELHK